jgi:hypothetical protein
MSAICDNKMTEVCEHCDLHDFCEVLCNDIEQRTEEVVFQLDMNEHPHRDTYTHIPDDCPLL